MRIAGILHESIVDGPGVRFVVFTQGCLHQCRGCHNPNTWDQNGGYEISVRVLMKEIHKSPKSVKGVTISGGEPFLQPKETADFAERVHSIGFSVVTYTGYVYEQLLVRARMEGEIQRLLDETDILVDGPFIEQQKDISLRFRGSSNQRVIDMNETRRTGEIELLSIDFE